ncbi:DUF6456 domain-containing protein [Aestuariibius insulae]|uniref:DUF6456 domain-containing protein n=1 Tax=Aestuariibius insulae TaxID=2058287 RepID=UPI00345E4E29
MTSAALTNDPSYFPAWVPDAARHYLCHTENGQSIRALARDAGCHASTVLRQIRRFETRRDDPLIDDALRKLGKQHLERVKSARSAANRFELSVETNDAAEAQKLVQEEMTVLRTLCDSGAVLAVAREMEKAVVLKETAKGMTQRTAIVDRSVAESLALKDWIAVSGGHDSAARVSRYQITPTGRQGYRKQLAEKENRAQGFEDAAVEFEGASERKPHRSRQIPLESPLVGLSRRRDKDGKPFLGEDLVRTGERLREDYELAQLGQSGAEGLDQAILGKKEGTDPAQGENASLAARRRVRSALEDLGPGLGDVVLRCCCMMEGMEEAERRMGWSARSGKVVLRIALQRLKLHYAEAGESAQMIG